MITSPAKRKNNSPSLQRTYTPWCVKWLKQFLIQVIITTFPIVAFILVSCSANSQSDKSASKAEAIYREEKVARSAQERTEQQIKREYEETQSNEVREMAQNERASGEIDVVGAMGSAGVQSSARAIVQGASLLRISIRESLLQRISKAYDSIQPARNNDVKKQLQQSMDIYFTSRSSEEIAIRSAKILMLQSFVNDLDENISYLNHSQTKSVIRATSTSLDDQTIKTVFNLIRDCWIKIYQLRLELIAIDDNLLEGAVVVRKDNLCSEISIINGLIPEDFTNMSNMMTNTPEVRQLLARFVTQYYERDRPNAESLHTRCRDLFIHNIKQSNLIIPETVKPN
ncbi:MAG TPA: hypothetical protein VGD40_12005 [Chryseosolibacter sp.]